MKNTIYMAVTPDELELPLFVTDNLAEMADKFHKTKACISSSICHERKGSRKSGVRFIKIKEEEETMIKVHTDGMHYQIPEEWNEKLIKFEEIKKMLEETDPYHDNRGTCNKIREIINR